MAIDDRLFMVITHTDGRTTRLGPDEFEAKNVPQGLTFSKTIPGGDSQLAFSVARRVDVEYSDFNLNDRITVYGAGGRIAWDGRLVQFPRSHGDSRSITPGAVGYSAALRDFTAFREIYVDRDPSHWGPPPIARKAALLPTISMGDFDWSQGPGGWTAALPNQALGAQTIAELWYSMPPGLKAATLVYKGGTNGTLTSWLERFLATDNEDGSSPDAYAWTLDNTFRSVTITTPRRHVFAQVYSNGNAITPAAGANRRLSDLTVFGNHGLPTYDISGEPDGLLASDIIEDAVSRCAPILDTSRIETTDLPIAHLAFPDPVTCEDVILDANKFHLWEWGVYGDREFFYRPPNPDRLTWEARLSSGAKIDFEGDTLSTVFNAAIVFFNDAGGIRRAVGPPAAYWPGGVAVCDYTNINLVDTSEENPWNARGEFNPVRLELDFPTNLTNATALGIAYMAEKALPQRRGTLVLQGTGSVQHPTRGPVPVWEVQPGDFIKLSDHDQTANVPRRIIQTQYDHSTRTLTATLDNTSAKLGAILSRVGVRQIGVAF